MPYIRSDISFKIFYTAFGAEIFRKVGTSGKCNEFRTSFKANLTDLRTRVAILWFLRYHSLSILTVILMCFKSSMIHPLHS